MNLGTIIGWYMGTLIIEALTYGSAGYLIFKLLKGKDKNWLIGAFVTFIVFLVWDGYFTNKICRMLGVTITNKAVLDFLGEDVAHLFEIDFSNILVAFIQIICGFKIAQIVARKLQKS